MAEENKDIEVTKEKSVTVNEEEKTPKVDVKKTTTAAPVEDKSKVEIPDAGDISDILMLLNVMDQEKGGKGEITEVPEALRGSISYLIEQLKFVRDLFEDPDWKAILDDMADQKEDGKTPSVEVAIVRNIPIEKIQQLAESEDYEGAQRELADNFASKKKTEEEDAMYDANFQKSLEAGEAYAAKMGYDEARKNELFQKVFDLYKVMADGILTEDEYSEVDKMLNYDPDTQSLKEQIGNQEAKEILPDQASVDAALSKVKTPTTSQPKDIPGMGSMGAYQSPAVDITSIGSRKRKG